MPEWMSAVGKDPDTGKDWRQEKGMAEGEMVGWHHWRNGHEFEQALGVDEGQGGLACCSLWGCKESDMAESLNNSNAEQRNWLLWPGQVPSCRHRLRTWSWDAAFLRVSEPDTQAKDSQKQNFQQTRIRESWPKPRTSKRQTLVHSEMVLLTSDTGLLTSAPSYVILGKFLSTPPFYYLYLFISFLVGCCSFQNLRSPTRYRTPAPSSEHSESSPLDHQEIPLSPHL